MSIASRHVQMFLVAYLFTRQYILTENLKFFTYTTTTTINVKKLTSLKLIVRTI